MGFAFGFGETGWQGRTGSVGRLGTPSKTGLDIVARPYGTLTVRQHARVSYFAHQLRPPDTPRLHAAAHGSRWSSGFFDGPRS
jgi:hypothetical protein